MPSSLDTAVPIQGTAPNPEITTIQPMRHRGRVKFHNGQVDHTPSAPPPRIRASQVAPEVSTRALALILQTGVYTIPLKFPLPSPIPNPCTIHDISIQIPRLTTL